MCFNNKYKYKTLHGGSCQIKTKKEKNKQKKKNKHFLKDCIEQFFNFLYKNIHDKIILFEAVLLVQKNTMRAGYAERNIN